MSELRAWLAKSKEPAIAASMPIVDPHHHLWDGSYPDRDPSHNKFLKPYMQNSMILVRYLADDMLSEIKESGHNIIGTVYLQCNSFYDEEAPDHLKSVGETKECQRVADKHNGLCNGIVSHVDLTQGAKLVEDSLKSHIKAGKNFKGIRHATVHDKQIEEFIGSDWLVAPKLYQTEAFQEGLGVLEKMDLVYETWVVHHQLKEVKELATAFPKLKIVVDHVASPLGFPPYVLDSDVKRQSMFKKWKKDISELAKECSNVYMKVGGLTMPLCGFGFEEQENAPSSIQLLQRLGPLYLHVIKEFGSSRCMFESNYPVDKECVDYGVMWNSFKRISHAANLSMFETRDLFFGTARHVYQLDISLPDESLYDTSNWGISKDSSIEAAPNKILNESSVKPNSFRPFCSPAGYYPPSRGQVNRVMGRFSNFPFKLNYGPGGLGVRLLLRKTARLFR